MNKVRNLLGKAIVTLETISIFFIVMSCNNTSPISTNETNNDGIVTDADGNVYHTVTIGTQTWTVENLRTTKYNDGTAITHVMDSTAWANLSTPAYCNYGNTVNSDSIKKFGSLYNWYAVNTGKLAPTGWHIPTDSEWTVLVKYLVMHGYNYDGTTNDNVGNKVGKSLAAQTDWNNGGLTGAIGIDLSKNNSSGFTALPGGIRRASGFIGIGIQSNWWSSTENNERSSMKRDLNYYYSGMAQDLCLKIDGLSVRLVKD